MNAKCSKPGCNAPVRLGHPCTDWDCPQQTVSASAYAALEARFDLEIDAYAKDSDLASLRTALSQEREAREKAEKEVKRCHERLEINHHFVLGDDNELVRVEVPMSERADEIDGIECRDATISLLETDIEHARERARRLEASLAEAKLLLKPFADAKGHFDGHVKDDDTVEIALRNIRARHVRDAARFLSQEPNHGR